MDILDQEQQCDSAFLFECIDCVHVILPSLSIGSAVDVIHTIN